MGLQPVDLGVTEACSIMGFIDVTNSKLQCVWESCKHLIGKIQRHHTKKLVDTNLKLEKKMSCHLPKQDKHNGKNTHINFY